MPEHQTWNPRAGRAELKIAWQTEEKQVAQPCFVVTLFLCNSSIEL